jgi:hypothetical protein
MSYKAWKGKKKDATSKIWIDYPEPGKSTEEV